MLRTRISIGERLSEGRGRSLSSVNWFCKETKYCACSHSEKCSPTALEESLVACSFKRIERHLCVMPYMFCHNLGKRPHIQYYFSINRLLSSEKTKIIRRHQKKLISVLIELKRTSDGITDNPNETIVNLTNHSLSSDELEVLKLGLRYGLATRPNQLEIMAVAEDVWRQISRLDIFKQGRYVQDKIKNSLRSFTYNYIDLDLKEFRLGRKIIDILNKLTERFAILKPDKGNGIVLLNRYDYVTSVKSIFSDSSKFEKLDSDPTLTRLHSLQNYLLQLHKRDEITDEQLDALTAHFGRAHGLPKTHKKFDTLPTFRPIIDTTNTPHYNVGKFLSSLLNPLTLNAHSLSDSFDAVTYINNIPRHLFQEGYQFLSFDVESLFTNVPLRRTVNIFLDRIYKDELITNTFKKRTYFKK